MKLGLYGEIHGFDIDTNHFTGNHPNSASIEACSIDGDPDDSTEWTEILPETNLNPGSQHLIEIDNDQIWTHVKLNIFPDGGVARLRIFGDVKKRWTEEELNHEIDLIAVENEGKVLTCSDMYFTLCPGT